MLVHLGMTGKFFFIDRKIKKKQVFIMILKEKKDEKHDRLIFNLSNKSKINL